MLEFKRTGLMDGGGSEWDESDHPRKPKGSEGGGRFIKKETEQSLGSGRNNRESGDIETGLSSYNKYKPQIQSQVFDKISTVRRRLEKEGKAIISVNDSRMQYIVKLYGANLDYDYEILFIKEIR